LLLDGTATGITEGSCGGGSTISQRRARVLVQDGWTTVVGSRFAHDEACGIILRKSRDAVMRENSRVLLPSAPTGRTIVTEAETSSRRRETTVSTSGQVSSAGPTMLW
jgi:hypothetical protein